MAYLWPGTIPTARKGAKMAAYFIVNLKIQNPDWFDTYGSGSLLGAS